MKVKVARSSLRKSKLGIGKLAKMKLISQRKDNISKTESDFIMKKAAGLGEKKKNKEDSEDEDSEADEEDEEIEDAHLHKEQLAKLKEKDPELYKFLQEEDADLLEFKDEGSDVEEDEEEEEEEKGSESTKKSRLPKTRKDRDGRQIFDDDMLSYLEEELEKEYVTRSSVRLAVDAFIACVSRVGAGISTPAWIIEDEKVFDAVVRLCFRRLGECVVTLLGKPKEAVSSSGTKIIFAHWKRYHSLAKTYLHALLLFLNEVQSPLVTVTTAKTIAGLSTLYAQFPRLVRLLVKALVRLWTRKTLECRCVAYFGLNALLTAAPEHFAFTYKSCYMGFVSSSREVTSDTWPLLLFMHRSFSQLSLLNPNIAYQYAFVYIRQTAIHIRNAVILNKRKDLVQSVYNWQLLQCLYIWTRVISHAHTVPDTEALRELTYPLVQIIISTLRLFPSQRYLPLRVHCVDLLIELQSGCDRYIPTLAFSIELMGEMVFLMKTKPRDTKISGVQGDITCSIKANSQQLESTQWRKCMVEEIFRLCVQSAHLISTHPSFPDVLLPLLHRLRSLSKACRNPETAEQLKSLGDKLKEHCEWVREKLAGRRIDVSDQLVMIGLRASLRDPKSPMTMFYQEWVRYWKMRQRLLTQSDSKNVKEGVEMKKEKKSKKAKKQRVEEEEEDEDSDERETREEEEREKRRAEGRKARVEKRRPEGRVRADGNVPDTVHDMENWSD